MSEARQDPHRGPVRPTDFSEHLCFGRSHILGSSCKCPALLANREPGAMRQRSEYPLTPGSAHSRDASSHIKNDQQGSIQFPTSLQSGCVSLRALLTLSGLLVPWGNNVKKEKTDSEGFF